MRALIPGSCLSDLYRRCVIAASSFMTGARRCGPSIGIDHFAPSLGQEGVHPGVRELASRDSRHIVGFGLPTHPQALEQAGGGILGNDHDAVLVPHDDVAGVNHDTAALNREVDFPGAAVEGGPRIRRWGAVTFRIAVHIVYRRFIRSEIMGVSNSRNPATNAGSGRPIWRRIRNPGPGFNSDVIGLLTMAPTSRRPPPRRCASSVGTTCHVDIRWLPRAVGPVGRNGSQRVARTMPARREKDCAG